MVIHGDLMVMARGDFTKQKNGEFLKSFLWDFMMIHGDSIVINFMVAFSW